MTYNDIRRKLVSESLKMIINEVFVLGKLILILNPYFKFDIINLTHIYHIYDI